VSSSAQVAPRPAQGTPGSNTAVLLDTSRRRRCSPPSTGTDDAAPATNTVRRAGGHVALGPGARCTAPLLGVLYSAGKTHQRQRVMPHWPPCRSLIGVEDRVGPTDRGPGFRTSSVSLVQKALYPAAGHPRLTLPKRRRRFDRRNT
jgi:hypothetical protein